MNLSQLHYFQVVAEEEHISRAAEKLHISQPSLSTTIHRLEDELDTPLFDHRGRNIYLNDAGKKLLEHVDFIFSQIDHLEKNLKQKELHRAHGLSIAVNNYCFIDGWLSNFILNNKGARISQSLMTEEQMLEALLNEDIDLALGDFSEIPPNISQHILLEDEYVVTVPINHHFSEKAELTFEDIRNEPFTAVPSNNVNCFIYPLFAQKNALPNVIFEGSQKMMLKLFYKGHALIFSTHQLIYTQLDFIRKYSLSEENPKILLLPIKDIDTSFKLSVCWKNNRELPIMAQKLLDALINDYAIYSDDNAFIANLPSVK